MQEGWEEGGKIHRDTVRSYIEGVRQQYKFVKQTQPD